MKFKNLFFWSFLFKKAGDLQQNILFLQICFAKWQKKYHVDGVDVNFSTEKLNHDFDPERKKCSTSNVNLTHW
jgi:hypothetical protein